MYRKEEMQTSSKKQVVEEISTEGDSVFVPVRCSPKIFPPRPLWNPFTSQVVFYDPSVHEHIAHALKDAPIQSMDEEEKKSFE